MSGISTDVIALAAILGSAAAAGATTMALSSDRSAHSSFDCVTTVVETAPRVVVSLGGDAGTFVVAPDVDVRTEETCSNMTRRGRVERLHQVEGEVARREIDIDGLKIELEGLEGVMMMELGGLGELLEMELEGLDEMLEMEIDGRLEDEMRKLEEKLERLERGNGR